MCTFVILEWSTVDKTTVCTTPGSDGYYVSPAAAPALGEFIYIGPLCDTPANDGWYIDFGVDPDVVFVVTGGNGEITSIESCTVPSSTSSSS